MKIRFCTELDKLLHKLDYAKNFNPRNIPYWEERIEHHKCECTICH